MSAENVCDNKKFWKKVKPLLSNQIRSSGKIILVERTRILKNDEKTANVLNDFFSTII